MNIENAIGELFICLLILTAFIIGLAWIAIQQSRRLKTLEWWMRRFDHVIDPEGTGDAYFDNLREEKRE